MTKDLTIHAHGKGVYRYIAEGRRAILPKSMANFFRLPESIDDWPTWAFENSHLLPNCSDAWFGFFDAIDRGERSGSAEVVLCLPGSNTVPYRLQFISTDEETISALISFEDISHVHQDERLRSIEMDAILRASHTIFSEIITVNLTRDTYRIVRYDSISTCHVPKEGSMDTMIDIRAGLVVSEDRLRFRQTFERLAMLRAFEREGRDSVQLTYRRIGQDSEWYWYETVVIRQPNPYDDDVLVIGMSRNVDEQKAEEERLRHELRVQSEELHLQTEELRLTMEQMGKTLNYYDIATRTITMSPAFAEPRGLPVQIVNYPESLPEVSREKFPVETLQALNDMYTSICRGATTGSREISITGRDGLQRWERLRFVTIFNDNGMPQRAVISVEDITDIRSRTEENSRLRENEQILKITARHSRRFVCYYDIQAGRSRRWNESICEKCPLPHLCEQSYIDILQSDRVLPDTRDSLEEMFHRMHCGKDSDGEYRIRFRESSDGTPRWFDIKYSIIRYEACQPSVALISFADITEQYEREMAYQRHLQMLQDNKDREVLFLEVDLDSDMIEQQSGGLLRGLPVIGKTHRAFLDETVPMYFAAEHQKEAVQFLSSENLLIRHAAGAHRLEATWLLRSHTGKERWLHNIVDLVLDPYTGHVKAFLRFEDITAEKQEQLAVQQQAEQDGMTGLLNRATCERRIREYLGSTDTRGGIMVLLDMDNLKGINDTFGHEQGDRAIRGIAGVLKTYFRKGDIVGRLGGDEFLIFLPGAAGNENPLALSLTNLLHKLGDISIGDNNERSIRCSIGCATQAGGRDSFEDLYRRADIALYQVKRNGKNNVAFYTSSMEEADYQFRNQVGALKQAKIVDWKEVRLLLRSVARFYPMIVSVDFATDRFNLMEAEEKDLFAHFPVSGDLDQLAEAIADMVHPDDAATIAEALSPMALLAAHVRGTGQFQYFCRCREQDSTYAWLEFIVIFHAGDGEHLGYFIADNIGCFILVRRAVEYDQKLDVQRLQTILEMIAAASFEYLCFIDATGGYIMYGNDGRNTHSVKKRGLFDEVTREIRDTHILPGERQTYYQNACLQTVLRRMHEDGIYTYSYRMSDGLREATFRWYDAERSELLMTVCRKQDT